MGNYPCGRNNSTKIEAKVQDKTQPEEADARSSKCIFELLPILWSFLVSAVDDDEPSSHESSQVLFGLLGLLNVLVYSFAWLFVSFLRFVSSCFVYLSISLGVSRVRLFLIFLSLLLFLILLCLVCLSINLFLFCISCN
jgi:hypothetical protein